jgi:hypothetical protein
MNIMTRRRADAGGIPTMKRQEGHAMTPKTGWIAVMLFLLAMGGIAGAEEKFGVGVYPGAKYDSGVTDFLKQISVDSAAYRTGDKVEKVMDYYKKIPGCTLLGGTKEGGMFRKGKTDVTIQNPWMDTKSGKMMNDTLISIVKGSE